jgi:hypothetical protein
MSADTVGGLLRSWLDRFGTFTDRLSPGNRELIAGRFGRQSKILSGGQSRDSHLASINFIRGLFSTGRHPF